MEQKKYAAAVYQVPPEDGLSREDYIRLLNMIKQEIELGIVTLNMLDGPADNAVAFGFADIESIDMYPDIWERNIQDFIGKIISDKNLENESCEYEMAPGFIVYIGYKPEWTEILKDIEK